MEIWGQGALRQGNRPHDVSEMAVNYVWATLNDLLYTICSAITYSKNQNSKIALVLRIFCKQLLAKRVDSGKDLPSIP